jgi:hypothetical protein
MVKGRGGGWGGGSNDLYNQVKNLDALPIRVGDIIDSFTGTKFNLLIYYKYNSLLLCVDSTGNIHLVPYTPSNKRGLQLDLPFT